MLSAVSYRLSAVWVISLGAVCGFTRRSLRIRRGRCVKLAISFQLCVSEFRYWVWFHAMVATITLRSLREISSQLWAIYRRLYE